MQLKKPVLITLDKNILKFEKRIAKKRGQNFSDFVEGLLEQDMLLHDKKRVVT
jgi:hypothetical protein